MFVRTVRSGTRHLANMFHTNCCFDRVVSNTEIARAKTPVFTLR